MDELFVSMVIYRNAKVIIGLAVLVAGRASLCHFAAIAVKRRYTHALNAKTF